MPNIYGPNGEIISVVGIVAKGQATKANSFPVVLASDSDPLPVSGGGAAQADKSAFVEGAGAVTPVAGVYNETAAGDPGEDQAAALRITAKRGAHVNLRSAAGVEQGTASAPLRTDPTGTTPQPVTGTVTANLGTLNGAATAAKQPALGTAGSASADVLTVQGAASGTPLPVSEADGANGALGAKIDSSATSDTGTFSLIALTKRLLQRFVVDSTDRLRVSLYGKSTAAGDTPVLVDANGRGTLAYKGTVNADNVSAPGGFVIEGDTSQNRAAAVGLYLYDGSTWSRARAFDVDTGAGTQYAQGVSLRKAASGGSVELGTSSDPVRTDPVGTTAQPVNEVAATNVANNQVALSTTAATILGARATRKQATIVNLSTSITVYIGVATVTSGNGFPLLPGQALDIFGTALIQGIVASGTPSVAYIDQYY